MKINTNFLANIALITTGLFTASSFAATPPTQITAFTAKKNHDIFTVRSKGWSDPAFGDMGWTHFSDWGSFIAKKGQTVKIKLVSESVGIHPGITVWFRGADDTSPDNYVVDHFYPQNSNFYKYGATDETTNEAIGNIVMRVISFGYDQDGNTKRVKRFNGIKDDKPGELELTFQAPLRGRYQFVVGGFNPDAGIDNSLKYNIDTTVNVTTPAP